MHASNVWQSGNLNRIGHKHNLESLMFCFATYGKIFQTQFQYYSVDYIFCLQNLRISLTL